MSRYLRYSRSAYYGVVAALPLLIAYELLLMAVGWSPHGQVRNAADVWLRMLLASLNIEPQHATLVMILVLVLAIPAVRRRDIELVPRYFAAVFVESALYSLVLGLVIKVILAFLFVALGGGTHPMALPAALTLSRGALQGLALSAGAGLFEEFVFRVVLVSLLLWVTRLIFAGWLAGFVSIVGAAFLFALAHHIGPYGEPLTLLGFAFRFVAGLLFTAIYYVRGFAVVAYTHALYDIRVILF